MKFLRMLALYWGIKGFDEKDFAKALEAIIDGTKDWYAKPENKKWLVELADFCGKGLIDHLKTTKDYEDNHTN